MSLALAPVRSTSVRTAPSLPDVPARPVSIAPRQAETATAAQQAAPADRAGAPRVRAVPEGTEARGFVLYVGIDEAKALEAGTTLHRIVEALAPLTADLAPSAETYAAVALAPDGAGGRDVDVVRLALQDPAALAKQRQGQGTRDDADRHPNGVIIDISRKRVLLDGEPAGLTYKEFELLQYLVLREGRTIDRHELIDACGTPTTRRRTSARSTCTCVACASKLGHYEDIVRTVRGVGYRFDRHADVSIRQASTPSPDLY